MVEYLLPRNISRIHISFKGVKIKFIIQGRPVRNKIWLENRMDKTKRRADNAVN